MSGLSARRCSTPRRDLISVAAIAMAIPLAGCTLLTGSTVEPDVVGAQPAESRAEFPNLGSVPDEPPVVSSSEQRKLLLERLAFDREASGLPGTTQTNGATTEGESD